MSFPSSLIIFFTCVLSVLCYPQQDRFFYFAYGSNLLANRLRIQNPSAVFYGIAKLDNYRLDFNMYVDTWRGAVATIVEEPGSTVWGALWTIDKSQLAHLDDQEGVDTNWYYAKDVKVRTKSGRAITARTYIETVNPPKVSDMRDLPLERRPSNTYMQVIILGAIDIGLPREYVEFLLSFPTNGRVASQEYLDRLGPPFSVPKPNVYNT